MKSIFKFSLAIFCSVIFAPLESNAQVPEYYNQTTYTNGNSVPFAYQTSGVRSDILWPAGDFGVVPSGKAIKTIYIQSYPLNEGLKTYGHLRISMKQENVTTLNSSAWETGMTEVLYTTNLTINASSTQWGAIELDNAFPYDPSLPLIIGIEAQMNPFDNWYWKDDGTNTTGCYKTFAIGYTSSAPTNVQILHHTLGFDLVDAANFPYCENFEDDNGNWNAGGAFSTWEHGEPSNSTISEAASGTNAWVTDLDGNHNNDEVSYITSPILNLSPLVDPVFKFNSIRDLESGTDGVQIQVSPDSGATWSTLGSASSNNWYNSSTVTSLLSSQGNAHGWTGSTSAWESMQHSLLSYANDTAVVVRVVLASNGSTNNEGFGVDDVMIGESNDIELRSLTFNDSVCGSASDTVRGVLCNISVEDKHGFGVDIDTNGVTIAYSYPDTLPVCGCDTVDLFTFNSLGGIDITVEAEVSNTGDVNPANDTINTTITQFRIPNVEISGDGEYCEGDAATLDFEFTGMSPWNMTYTNGNNTTTISNITQNPLSLIAWENGTYTVSALSDASGCAGDSAAFIGSAEVIVNPAPAINLGPDVSQCGPYTMNAGGGLSAYNWSTGETTQSITAVAAGTYSVTVTDANDCTNSDTIELDLLPLPNITLSDTILCEGGTHVFNAGAGGASYLWDDGSTGQVRSVSSAGSVSVTVTGFNGCVASSSAAITQVVSNPNPSITAGNGYAPVTLDAGPGYAGYLWNTAATTQQILVSSPGSYTCTVTDLNGCKGTASGSPDIWATGVEDVLAKDGFALFPNPADNATTLRIDNTRFDDDLRIELIDISGKVLLTQTNVSDTQIELSTENLSSGSYVVRLISGDASTEQSLVVRH
ncbi:MAG: hypothetical protein Salg2KO_06110 [Salibacteraceae bacterium]